MNHRDWRYAAGLAIMLAVFVAPASLAAQAPAAADMLPNGPAPAAILVSPRVYAAYGAIIAAATLSLLYFYRGRGFILYWVGSWILIATALAVLSGSYEDLRSAGIALGYAFFLIVWSAALIVLAAGAFQGRSLTWSATSKLAALATVGFLVSPLFAPPDAVISAGTIVSSVLLAWAGVRYFDVVRRTRFAGAFLMGIGFSTIAVANVSGLLLFQSSGDSRTLSTPAAVTIVTSIFIALAMHLLVFEDMTDELRRTNRDLTAAHDEVKRLAITDPLTGCHNRRFFDEIERREIQRHRRYGLPLSVVFADIDRFKQFNDTLGHDRGDDVLRAIGMLLRRQVRESDYVIRWGGDEFLMLLACGEADARAKAAELQQALGHERDIGLLPPDVGLSIGVAAVSRDASSLRDAIREADSRMYRQKATERAAL